MISQSFRDILILAVVGLSQGHVCFKEHFFCRIGLASQPFTCFDSDGACCGGEFYSQLMLKDNTLGAAAYGRLTI